MNDWTKEDMSELVQAVARGNFDACAEIDRRFPVKAEDAKPTYGTWRSIKTAPSRTRVMVLTGSSCRIASSDGLVWSSDTGTPLFIQPTHWMPLPEVQ